MRQTRDVADVFLTLGAALVRAALRVWVKDDILAGAGTSIVDLVKGKISDDLEQRRAQRLFEDLEVPVANRLRALRNTEFAAMPENEWCAAVLAAGVSFDRANLTARDLFTRDLDPLSLEQLVRADRRLATRDLSADGTALYDRIVSESCAYVIEISDKLPDFQRGAIAELLRRDREIVDLINKVLDRIPKRASDDTENATFVTAYLRHVATRLDRLELFGLDFESPWYPLSVAYVSLATSLTGDIDHMLIPKPPKLYEPYEKPKPPEPLRIILLGRPGSGKTTVLQRIAVRAARSEFASELEQFNGYIPFYIRLREYVGKAFPAPENFIKNIAPMMTAEMPANWVRSQLRTGRSFVLVDGVDELPIRQREEVSKWLEDLTHLFPKAHYVVTSRPAAIRERWLADHRFIQTSLEAMSPPLIEAFIRRWYEAARHRLPENEESERLNRYEQSLSLAVHDDKHLRDLADTPLLAGLLCALNRHLRSQLPRRRSEIYERAIVMFDQRDRIRGIDTGEVVIDVASKTHLLADLALWMVRNGESEVEADAVRDLVKRSLATLTQAQPPAAEVFRILLERSGLLREPAVDRVDFIHRTFQSIWLREQPYTEMQSGSWYLTPMTFNGARWFFLQPDRLTSLKPHDYCKGCWAALVEVREEDVASLL